MSLTVIYDKEKNQFRYVDGTRTDSYVAAMIAAERNDTEMLNTVKQYHVDNNHKLKPYYRCVFVNAAGRGHLDLVQKTASSFHPSSNICTDAVIEAMLGTKNVQVINWLLQTYSFHAYEIERILRCSKMKGLSLLKGN